LFSVLVLGPILSPLPAREYFTHPQTIEYLRNLFLDIHYVLPLVFASNPYPNVVNGSLWTLPLEAFMYVLVMLAGMTKCLTGRGCAVVALAFAWLHFAVPSTAFTDNGVVLHVMLYSELTRLGVLYFIGAAFVFAPARWIENKEAAWFAVGMLALFAESPIAELIATVTLPIIVLTIASRPSRVSVALGKVGDLSYGVYVYAFPIQQIAALLLGARVSPASVILLSLPATLILSFASWHLIEKKALRLKNVLGRRAALATGAQ
jgi:peptidoglycan/LPS O-acetylase OafA/YrhL